jgi:hypothetical protein
MKTKLLFLVMAACFTWLGAGAQTQVKIIDLTVIPAMKTDLSPQSNDSVAVNVVFKTQNASQAANAYLLFGTTQDASDIKLAEAHFTTAGGSTNIEYAGITKPVINYSTELKVVLSKSQYETFKNVALYVEDINGQQTPRLHFRKNI